MSNNQIVDELDWKPSVIKSEITQQMIDEHRAEQNAPVKITRPDGREEFFKYDPTSIDLTPITPTLEPVLSDADIRALKARQLKNAVEISAIDKNLREELPKERKKIIDEYNAAKAGDKDFEHYAELTRRTNEATKKEPLQAIAKELGITINKHQKTIKQHKEILTAEIDKQAKAPTKSQTDFEVSNQLLDEAVEKLTEERATLVADIDDIVFRLDQNKKAIHQNDINTAEAEKRTRTRNKEAAGDLKVRNTGKAIPEQQPGETDEQYRQRLVDLGDEVLDDDEVQRNAESLQIVKAKYNLKEFLSDASKIENIIKKLSSDELTVFNTSFPAYKKKYLETYGFNNRNMNVDDIVDFIQTGLTAPAAAATPPPAPPAAAATAAPTRAANRPYAFSTFNKSQLLHLTDTNGLPRRRTNQEMYDALLSQDLIPRINDPYHVPAFPDVPTGAPVLYPTAPTGTPLKASPAKFPAVALGPTMSGIGVHLRRLPSVVQFGKIHIKPSNLYYENILSVRTSTGQALRAYKDEKISNHLASLIIKLLEGGTVSKNDLRSLSEKEVMIYDNLIRRSQLHKELDNSWDETAIKMKKRFEILEGEYYAGNDNPLIKQELHELLFKMGNAKIITPHEASRYWNELNK